MHFMSHPQQGDLPSAVFFGFQCISLTTHSHKLPIAEWDVSKIISDVSYLAIVKRSHRICLQSFSLPVAVKNLEKPSFKRNEKNG